MKIRHETISMVLNENNQCIIMQLQKLGAKCLPLQKLKAADLIIKSATFFLSSTFYLNSFDVLILLAPI